MGRMRKLWAGLLVVCMLSNLYGVNVLAAVKEHSVAGENRNGSVAYSEGQIIQEQIEGTENNSSTDETGGAGSNDSADKTDDSESGETVSTGETEEEDLGNPSGETEDNGSEDDSAGDTGDGTEGDSAEDTGDEIEGDSVGETEDDDSENTGDGDSVDGSSDGDHTGETDKSDKDDSEEETYLLMEKTAMAVAAEGEVSRVEWLTDLTETFSISVAEDNYPDNYFSDIDSSSEYYYVVMLATEFGLVDVEAGEPFRPDDPATREFAAHTLNFCLGFLLEQEGNYTFSEASDVTYADDIQVAVERGWFSLENGSFYPETPVTLDEKTIMIEDAKSVLADRKEPTEHSNSYTLQRCN